MHYFYIFVRDLFDVLYEYLQPIFSPSQFRFRNGRTGVIQLVVYMKILSSFHKFGENNDVNYSEYEKAFDKVDHGLLLQKLQNIGIGGRILKSILSYLK